MVMTEVRCETFDIPRLTSRMEDVQITGQKSAIITITDPKKGHVTVSLPASAVDELAGEGGLRYIFEIVAASGVLMRAMGELTVVAIDPECDGKEG